MFEKQIINFNKEKERKRLMQKYLPEFTDDIKKDPLDFKNYKDLIRYKKVMEIIKK